MPPTKDKPAQTWAEQWAKLFPRPEWDDPAHWESARNVMKEASRDDSD